nr:SJCHGC09258 protein [Schistosoma japonicum]
MSDDSFIDDSEALQSKEYARVVRDIHRALKFDPRRYKDVNPYEDLRCMEAKYCDIEKEERRSARLAALEDNEELIRDMKRRKEKMIRKRQQFLDDND